MIAEHHLEAPISELDVLDDDALLGLARTGNADAFAELYDRYVYGAKRLARHLGQREDSDDVVSDAFERIFDLLKRGKGPDRAFRAYLFTTIRHESGRRAKAAQRVRPTDDEQTLDTAVAFGAGQLDGFEQGAIRAAYESLPERWRSVLWHLDVEGRKPNELAELMGMKANGVSALVYRARAGLREAYLQQHVSTGSSTGPECDEIRPKLVGFVRRTASARDQERVHVHLNGCTPCMQAYVELDEVSRSVG